MLKILGRGTSSNVQKVLWVCGEINLPFERDDIGGPYGGNDTSEYLAMNPNGRVPTIIDDGFVLWESNAITRYLAAKYGGPSLYPEDLTIRAAAERWMDWQQTMVSPHMVPVFWGLVRTPPEERNMGAIEAARKRLSTDMAIMNKHLAGNAYMVGDHFTIGDIPLGIAAFRWFNMDMNREDYPHLKTWYERLTQRPAYQEHVMNPME